MSWLGERQGAVPEAVAVAGLHGALSHTWQRDLHVCTGVWSRWKAPAVTILLCKTLKPSFLPMKAALYLAFVSQTLIKHPHLLDCT